MAVQVRQLAPAADVRCFVQDAEHGRGQPAAGLSGRRVLRRPRPTATVSAVTSGPAVPLPSLERLYSVPLDADELCRVELRPLVPSAPCGVTQRATWRLVRQEAICRAVPYTPPRCFSGALMTPPTALAVSR